MKIDHVALQLYTVRDFCQDPAGLAESIRRVREIGYRAVQVSGIGPIPYPEVRNICDGEGIAICATHEPAAMVREEPRQVVARLNSLGCRMTAYPYPHDVDFNDQAQIEELIADLSRAGEVLAEAGMTLNYHNHALELIRHGDRTILDSIFDKVDAKRLGAELDTYWIQFGGGDPAAWCRKLGGRLHVLHLKDYAITAKNEPVFAEVGSGNLDFKSIIAAAIDAGCQWFVVEQDKCPGDPFESARRSFEYICDNLLEGNAT